MPNTFFNPHQRATIEAAMARIIPTDDTPGRSRSRLHRLCRPLSVAASTSSSPSRTAPASRRSKGARPSLAQRIEIMRGRYLEGIARSRCAAARQFRRDFVDLLRERSRMRSCTAVRKAGTGRTRRTLAERHAGRSSLGASPRCSRPRPRSTSTSCRCSSRTPARASTPIRSTAETGTGSAGR